MTDWAEVGDALDREGCAVLADVVAPADVAAVLRFANAAGGPLMAVAERWMARLGRDARFDTVEPTARVTRLKTGERVALHRPDDEDAFPLRLVAVLGRPNVDFTGGDFIVVEQRPRMQSRPMVVPLRPGDVAVVASGRRPHRGTRGDYAVTARHGIGRVVAGERIGLEVVLRGHT